MKTIFTSFAHVGTMLWGLIAATLVACMSLIVPKRTDGATGFPFPLNRKGRRYAAAMGRYRTCDVAFPYRMGAGFPGDVNRTHPASIEPALFDATNPPLAYGIPVLTTTSGNSVRPFAAGDSAVTNAYGWTVRPFPYQPAVAAGAYGADGLGAAIPPPGIGDVMRTGYIMVQVSASTAAAVVKGGRVYVWIGAAGGGHVVGGIEAAASSGNTIQLGNNVLFNGPTDASGVTEISVI